MHCSIPKLVTGTDSFDRTYKVENSSYSAYAFFMIQTAFMAFILAIQNGGGWAANYRQNA